MFVLVEEVAAKYRTKEPSACHSQSPTYHRVCGGPHKLGDIRCPHVACAPRWYCRESVTACHRPGIEIWRRCDLNVLGSIGSCKSIVRATDVDESRIWEIRRDDRTV